MKRFLWLGFALFLYVTCGGCGETFRPIIIPNPPTFPNPAAAHTVVTISDNGSFVAGSAMVIDVSGDSVESIANTDIHPVHAAQQSASEVLVLNQAATAAETGGQGTTSCLVSVTVGGVTTVYDVCPSLTLLNFSGTSIGSTNSITLPIYSSPNFVAVAPLATTAYVTLPTYPPDPTNPQTIAPSVEAINTTTKQVTIVPVGSTLSANPYALAVTPDNTKLYVANQGDGTVDGFNTVGPSTRQINGSLSSKPIWLSARSDSQAVYVLEESGLLAYISITSTLGPDMLTETANPPISVPGAIKMVYDGNLNRLYISGGNQVAIVDVSQPVPALIVTIPITAVLPSTRSAQDPCSTTAVTTLNTVDVAALPDESFAYAGTYYEAAVGGINYICPQVTAINLTSNSSQSPAIAIPGFTADDAFCSISSTRFRLTMAAGGDSTRAYLASCDGGNVNIIDTSAQSYIESQPVSVCQNPVFMLAGP